MGENYKIHLKTDVPREFFQSYLAAPFDYHRQPVDPGCAQKDFIQIDAEKTLNGFREFYRSQKVRLAKESRWLADLGIDLVVSDVPGLPLKAARDQGIASLLIGNFTWYDIYRGLSNGPSWNPLLDELAEEYACATRHLLCQCHLETPLVADRKEIGFIANRGKNVRDRLIEELGLEFKNKVIVFIYFGQQSASRIDWNALGKISDCVFITRDPHPRPPSCDNFYVLDERFRYPDLIASCDVVCTKAGYSTLATAFAHGKPVLCCDREDFCEIEAMKKFINENEVGLTIPSEDFYSGNWGESIKHALQLTVKGKVMLDGEIEVLNQIRELMGAP